MCFAEAIGTNSHPGEKSIESNLYSETQKITVWIDAIKKTLTNSFDEEIFI